MAHFAELDNNNTVLRVVVVSNDVLENKSFPESEQLGVAFLNQLYGYQGNWKQTSYHGSFRGRFSGIGHNYLPDHDTFMPPAPYPSWKIGIIGATGIFDWVPPVDRPDCKNYIWYENRSGKLLAGATGLVGTTQIKGMSLPIPGASGFMIAATGFVSGVSGSSGFAQGFWIYIPPASEPPFPSWQLDKCERWQPPVAMPTDPLPTGQQYNWNEKLLCWQVRQMVGTTQILGSTQFVGATGATGFFYEQPIISFIRNATPPIMTGATGATGI